MNLKKTLVLFLLILSNFSFAATDAWHEAEIKTIYPLADGNFIIIFKFDSANCPATNNGKYHYVEAGAFGMTKEGVKNALSVALSAAAMGKILKINFDTSNVKCSVNRMQINF